MGNGRGLIPDSADLIGAILDADPRAQLRRRLHAAGQVDALLGDRADVRVGYDAAGQPLVLESVPVQAGFQPAVGDWVRLVYPNDDPSAALVEGPTVTQSTDPPGGGVPSVVDQTQVKPDAIESDAYTAPPGHLRDNLDHLRAVVKALKGTAAWITTTPATLQEARDHIDNLSNPHHTSLEQARTESATLAGGVYFAAGLMGWLAAASDGAVRLGADEEKRPQFLVIREGHATLPPGRAVARMGASGFLVQYTDGVADPVTTAQFNPAGGAAMGTPYSAPSVDGGVVLGGLAAGGGTPVVGAGIFNNPASLFTVAAGSLLAGNSVGRMQFDPATTELRLRAATGLARLRLVSDASVPLLITDSAAYFGITAAKLGVNKLELRIHPELSPLEYDFLDISGATTSLFRIRATDAIAVKPLRVGSNAAPTSGWDLHVTNAARVDTFARVGSGTVIATQATGDVFGGAAVSGFQYDESAAALIVRGVGTTSDVQWDRQGPDQWHTPDHIQADLSFYLGRSWESGNSTQGTIRLTRDSGALVASKYFIRANKSGDAGERMVLADDRLLWGGGSVLPSQSDEGFVRTDDGGTIYLDYWASGSHRFNNSDIRYMAGVDLFPNVDNDIQFGFRAAPGTSGQNTYRAAAAIITHRLELRDQRASSKQGDVLFVDTSPTGQTPGTTFHDFGGGKTLKYSGLWINVNGTVYAIPAIVDTGVTAPTGPSVPL